MFVGPHVSEATSGRCFILDPSTNHIAYTNDLALSILQVSAGLNYANYYKKKKAVAHKQIIARPLY